MGDYLELITNSISDDGLAALLDQELGEHPGLRRRLHLQDGTVSMKLATNEDVDLTFDEMVALYWCIQRHQDILEYGPRHEYNATPEQILKARSSLYLGAREERGTRKTTVRIPQECSAEIEHESIWRKTKKIQSNNGRTYYRKVKPDETSHGRGNPNGYRAPCPNTNKGFRALEVGFAWNWETNQGRTLYRCPPCGVLFNRGEYDTPELAALADALRSTKPIGSGGEERSVAPQPEPQTITRYRVGLVRESAVPYDEPINCGDPDRAARFIHRVLESYDREVVGALFLSHSHRATGHTLAYIGTLTSASAEPRGLLVPALLANAASIIMFHNHPSGETIPSRDDNALTKKVIAAGDILGVKVLDHIIIGEPPHYASLRQLSPEYWG
jgi:DNA repair protein RadC